jgi:hypothetical protein
MFRNLMFTAVSCALLLSAGEARAATYTLADLVGGGTSSFSSDDGALTFSNFDVTRTKRLSSDLSLYTVTTTQDGFVLTSGEFDAATGGYRKLDLSYTVTGSSAIVQAGLAIDATRSSGRVAVTKDIDDADPSGTDGTILVTVLSANASLLSDNDQFSPGVMSFNVEEQVRIRKVSTLSSVTNAYQVVPEPTTAALLGAGVLGLAWFGRRRAQ